MKKSTMADVAQLANVSMSTVSHVINGTRFVSEEVTNRVNNAITELNYVPNLAARNLRTGYTNTIMLIIPNISSLFFATLVDSVEEYLVQNNYRLLIANTKENIAREITQLRSLREYTVDGLLLASTQPSWDELKKELPADIPTILVERIFEKCPLPQIWISNYNAMYQAVCALIEKGHSRIGYISGFSHISTSKERFQAYCQAMTDKNIPIRKEYVQNSTFIQKEYVACCKKLLEIGCTGIVIASGLITNDLMNYFYCQNIAVGRDISIVGYNDTLYPQYFLDSIYAIHQPSEELGTLAGRQILQQLQNPKSNLANEHLHAIVREPETFAGNYK